MAEGDLVTPIGNFAIKAVLYRSDRLLISGSRRLPKATECPTGNPPRATVARPATRFRGIRRSKGHSASDKGHASFLNFAEFRAIGPHDVWSDDPDDLDYNSGLYGIAGLHHRFSHERLRRGDPVYDLIAVLDYNFPHPVYGLGSAMFLHVWRSPRHPTAGCVAFRKSALIEILQGWTVHSRVIIK